MYKQTVNQTISFTNKKVTFYFHHSITTLSHTLFSRSTKAFVGSGKGTSAQAHHQQLPQQPAMCAA